MDWIFDVAYFHFFQERTREDKNNEIELNFLITFLLFFFCNKFQYTKGANASTPRGRHFWLGQSDHM